MKKIIIIFALIIGILIPNFASAQITQANIQSVVQVRIYDNSWNFLSWGSGVVGALDGFGILTNYHVVEDAIKYPSDYKIIICHKTDTYTPTQCDWMAHAYYYLGTGTTVDPKYDEDLDLAIINLGWKWVNGKWTSAINLPGSSFADFRTVDFSNYGYTLEDLSKMVNISDEIQTLGFPDYAGEEMSYAKGYMTRFDYSYNALPTIVTNANISFGSSGGAAFDKNGKFIGITSAGVKDNNGNTIEGYIIPATSINFWYKYAFGKETYDWHGVGIAKGDIISEEVQKSVLCMLGESSSQYDRATDDCVNKIGTTNNTNSNTNNNTSSQNNSSNTSSCWGSPDGYGVYGSLSFDIVGQSPYPSTLKAGESFDVWLEIRNTGTAIWYNCGKNPIRLGAGSKYGNLNQQRDYHSEFYDSSTWLSDNRANTINDQLVNPGQTTKFYFKIKAPSTAGTYKAYFTPVSDGYSWMNDYGIYWKLDVTANNTSTTPPAQNTIQAPSSGTLTRS